MSLDITCHAHKLRMMRDNPSAIWTIRATIALPAACLIVPLFSDGSLPALAGGVGAGFRFSLPFAIFCTTRLPV